MISAMFGAMRWLRGFRSVLAPAGNGTGRKEFFTPIQPFVSMLLPATKFDYSRAIGDGLGSSVLLPPLNWIMRNFPQAPPVIERLHADGEREEWQPVLDHPLRTLLARPNAFYSGRELWMATVLDLCLSGNAYWLLRRNGLGEVAELWWVPSTMIWPRWPQTGTTFLTGYEYNPVGGTTVVLDPGDVVHLRHGLDPRNPRLGLSPLAALAREVFTDDQAANFTSVILKNLGVIGIIIAPKERGMASREDVERTKDYLLQHFTGDERGKPLALGQPTDVQLLQYNLQGFDVSPLRDVAEERVCAALGIPAAVVGFGTGLQTTKVGVTMREMRRMAWTDAIIPLQDMIAAQVGRQLLDPEAEPPERIRFDLREVPALWEDANERHARVRADYLAGLITRAEAKRELGYAVTAGDAIYAQPANVVLTQPGANAMPGGGGPEDAAADT